MSTAMLQSSEASLPGLSEPTAADAAATATSQTMSADEVALYDRQIRLWGMEAQTRMRNANVLIVMMRALGNEVAKNLVLAGIGRLTVLDPDNVVEDDLGSQFFVTEEHVGMNRAEAAQPAMQKLNPRVPVHTDTDSVRSKAPEYFKSFDIVIATDLDIDNLLYINAATRTHNVPFYAAATYGLYGFIFADLLAHTFVLKRIKSNVPTQLKRESRTRTVIAAREIKEGDTVWEFVTKKEEYVPLSDALNSEVDRSWRPRKRKLTPALLPAIVAVWKFQSAHGRLPEPKKADFTEFARLITEANRDLGLPGELVKAEFIRMFVTNATAELSPVAAVLGGFLAQDAINVLAKMEQPIQNLLVFDGDISLAPVIVLAPQAD